ncbi:MAG: hypothetical protein JXR80_05015 [Deltaproteobacteria bacterium]|nr:hypothetical protein [Deltaproteobacteria bacterium]
MSKQKRKLFWFGLAALVIGALGLGACKTSVGLKFSHRFHIVEQEASCDQCHKKGDNGNFLAATMADCQECHEFNPEEPSEACLLCHTPESATKDYAIEKSEKPAKYADLIFSHEPHADFNCDSCHKSSSKDFDLNNSPLMTTCISCHTKQGAPQECEACHKVIRAEQAPESHAQDWESRHGFASRLSNSCAYCHPNRQAFCEKCHQTEKPKDHIFSWKTTGHGVEASHDRRICATCHTAGYCIDCHKHQKPVSHFTGDWMAYQRENGHAEAARRNFRSCNVCHETGECMKCHKGIILRK